MTVLFSEPDRSRTGPDRNSKTEQVGTMSRKPSNGTVHVPKTGTVRILGYYLVPVAFDTEVQADTIEDACQKFANAIAGGLIEGESVPELRTAVAIQHMQFQGASGPVGLSVPERYQPRNAIRTVGPND